MDKLSSPNLHIVCSIIGFISFLLVLFFNYSTSNPSLGIFNQPTGNVSNKYEVFITPSGWTFIIWAIIYTWMAVAIIYALSQLCRRTEQGPLYLKPVTVPIAFWALFTLNQALNVAWLFVWDREQLTAAAIFLGLVVITNWLAMYTLHVRLYQGGSPVQLASTRELVLLRVCMHNGLAVYTAWTTVAALLNLDIALVHVGEVSNELASAVIAIILGAGILVWLIVEVTVLDRYTRWTITPGFTLVWALSGVFDKNYGRATGPVPAVLASVLGVACAALALRLIALAVFAVRRPLSGPQDRPEPPDAVVV